MTNSSTVTNRRSSSSLKLKLIDISESVYTINIDGVNYSFEADGFYRDYDDYDPDEPPVFD